METTWTTFTTMTQFALVYLPTPPLAPNLLPELSFVVALVSMQFGSNLHLLRDFRLHIHAAWLQSALITRLLTAYLCGLAPLCTYSSTFARVSMRFGSFLHLLFDFRSTIYAVWLPPALITRLSIDTTFLKGGKPSIQGTPFKTFKTFWGSRLLKVLNGGSPEWGWTPLPSPNT